MPTGPIKRGIAAGEGKESPNTAESCPCHQGNPSAQPGRVWNLRETKDSGVLWRKIFLPKNEAILQRHAFNYYRKETGGSILYKIPPP